MQLHLAAASPFSVWTSISRIVCLLEVMWRKKTVQHPEAERHEVKLSKGFFKVFTSYFIIENQQSGKNVNYLWYFVCLFHLLFYKNRDPLEYQYIVQFSSISNSGQSPCVALKCTETSHIINHHVICKQNRKILTLVSMQGNRKILL